MPRIFPTLFAVSILVGCASAELKNAETQCTPEAYSLHPVSMQQRVETRLRTEMKGTGQISCTSSGITNYMSGSAFSNTTTNCTEFKVPVSVPYEVTVSVDVNRGRREVFINDCALRTCRNQYGYGDKCKSGL